MAGTNDASLLLSDSKSEKKRKTNWCYEETSIMLNHYKENFIDIRKTKRNKIVYETISEKLKLDGFSRHPNEIRKKIENLTCRYRDEKAKIGSSGGSPSNFIFYNVIHEIIGTLPSQDHTNMVESYNFSFEEKSNGPSTSVSLPTTKFVDSRQSTSLDLGPSTSMNFTRNKLTDSELMDSSLREILSNDHDYSSLVWDCQDSFETETISSELSQVENIEKENINLEDTTRKNKNLKRKTVAEESASKKKRSLLGDFVKEFHEARIQNAKDNEQFFQLMKNCEEMDEKFLNIMEKFLEK